MNDIDKLILIGQKPTTSHVLHLLLTIITFGLWIPVWITICLVNQQRRTNIDRRIKRASKISS